MVLTSCLVAAVAAVEEAVAAVVAAECLAVAGVRMAVVRAEFMAEEPLTAAAAEVLPRRHMEGAEGDPAAGNRRDLPARDLRGRAARDRKQACMRAEVLVWADSVLPPAAVLQVVRG